MLEGLDRVDWATLTHSYGSAADVPADLRALALASTCNDALERLTSTIYHQGSIYKATAPAVSFLAEILEGAPTPCKLHALELLSLISMGCGWHQAHKDYSILASRRDTPGFDFMPAAEKSPWWKRW